MSGNEFREYQRFCIPCSCVHTDSEADTEGYDRDLREDTSSEKVD